MDGATWALIKATDTLSPIGWYLTSLTWPTVKYLQKIDWFYFLWMDIIIITSIIPHIITPMTTSTPIHARAWKEKALAGYNSQQIPTNHDVHKMLIVIISLRWKHFVIISYLYKIPTINEPYNQRKRDIRYSHSLTSSTDGSQLSFNWV